jgi:hypothetical protein
MMIYMPKKRKEIKIQNHATIAIMSLMTCIDILVSRNSPIKNGTNDFECRAKEKKAPLHNIHNVLGRLQFYWDWLKVRFCNFL